MSNPLLLIDGERLAAQPDPIKVAHARGLAQRTEARQRERAENARLAAANRRMSRIGDCIGLAGILCALLVAGIALYHYSAFVFCVALVVVAGAAVLVAAYFLWSFLQDVVFLMNYEGRD